MFITNPYKIMSMEFVPSTEIEKQRSAWFAERAKPNMSLDEYWRLNQEAYRLFPRTAEERQQKFERLKGIPEFVL
jgi:hypothetical protein